MCHIPPHTYNLYMALNEAEKIDSRTNLTILTHSHTIPVKYVQHYTADVMQL